MNDILYDYALSGNCYKIRLLAALLNVSYELRAVDYYPGGAHRGPEFLAVNPAGTLPAYVHEGEIFTESAAILSLLAARYDASGQWLPVNDPGPVCTHSAMAGFLLPPHRNGGRGAASRHAREAHRC